MESRVALIIFFVVAAAYGASLQTEADKLLLTIDATLNSTEDANPKEKTWLLPPGLNPFWKSWDWVKRPASVLPYKCNFVYGGGYNRMLYVGRVRRGLNIIPAAIHHYGNAGSETVRFIQSGEIKVGNETEWLCSNGRLGWARVEDLSVATIIKSRAVPIGYNATSRSLTYGCLAHSFFLNDYPASLGTVRDGSCIFEVDGAVVSSSDFSWWHTLELLVAF